MDERYWDARYGGATRLWSGEPNGVLVVEAADLPPGQALDVGCGEGGDALWLASRGWFVTAVDISRVALARAVAAAASRPGADRISWTHADLTATAPPAASFDLVVAMYCPIPRRPNHAGLHGILAAVAPGGTLLVGNHDVRDHAVPAEDPAADPSLYYDCDEIAAQLGAGWTVLANEVRERVSPAPPGSGHVNDVVLVARRDNGDRDRTGS
ncbi:class I SAM-dependent methyltransferase [Actinophytocola xanthii]|uniref:SAM-dependent methyltransferase n=1 Tax=Actinophytocola xanthii TaxID=1912961 RepID=A0A1Q8CM78_9PSEU|nr:class I SAM-dependent methyltransferase [Actinophytocola xanthii]OLF15459.1 SAM-dependent methyltransferase [Actinophytocola xanthii]